MARSPSLAARLETMKKALALFITLSWLISSPAVFALNAQEETLSLLDTTGMLALVNQQNRISKTYVPADLVLPRVATRKASLQENIYLREEAAKALEAMFEAAFLEESYTLYAASGYRSFGIQQILFNAKVEEVGSRARAQLRVAAPGTSEHQLGLVMDIQAPSHLNLSLAFGETEEGKWAGENAHRFGFILRYKQAWRPITGVVDEPWHFRYVGIAHARAMYQLDIPLETYVEHARTLPEYVLAGASHVLLAGLVGELMAGQQPAHLAALYSAASADTESALRLATAPYLTEDQSYEQALWLAYPTPRPTAAPWADEDGEEVSLPALPGGG